VPGLAPVPSFCDELGGAIHPQRLTQWFREHRDAAGIPTGTLHTLRHTAATLALTPGVPVHIVAARLGDTPNHGPECLQPLAAIKRRDSRRARGSRAHGRRTR
jgi:hypothetical protein